MLNLKNLSMQAIKLKGEDQYWTGSDFAPPSKELTPKTYASKPEAAKDIGLFVSYLYPRDEIEIVPCKLSLVSGEVEL